MEPMQRIRSLRDVIDRYDAVLCDVWGVVHDGRAVLPGVPELLSGLRESGTVVVLLTNVPRPSTVLPVQLRRLGLPDGSWDAIVTSGDVIRLELARRSPGPMHRIGRASDAGLWDGLGLEMADLDRASFLAIAGLRDAEESPEDYAGILRAARARDLELLCANPDIQVQSGDRLLWCAGAVAREYAALGGRVVQAGKPHAPIYARARDAIDRVVHRHVPTERILAVGDGIATDIVGANRVGLDSVFVGTGIHGDSLLTNGYLDMGRAEKLLRSCGAAATYAMARLA